MIADRGAGSRAGVDEAPLDAAAFAALMAALGPFEPRPRLAVGVSGGADSMALCLLAQEWALARDGSALALTVDHGLRPDSADEARRVGAWLAARGVEHEVLAWVGPKPASGVQDAARVARLALLEARCRAGGVLHLLLAHHREDQAETVLLRLARGSGPDGLAGMAPVRAAGSVRVLRPLLGTPRARLAATLAARGQAWLDDPSNASERFARVRLRRNAAALAREGLSAATLGETALRCAGARAALEGEVARLLAEAAEVHPEGFLLLDPAPLRGAGPELRLRALGRCVEAVGGGGPVRRERVARVAEALPGAGAPSAWPGRTVGGCLVRPWRGRVLVAREPEAAVEAFSPTPGEPRRWDGRFLLGVDGPRGLSGLRVARLGEAGRLALRRRGDGALARLPAPVAASLPALWAGDRLVGLPDLGGPAAVRGSGGHMVGGDDGTVAAWAVFAPARPLCGSPFAVV